MKGCIEESNLRYTGWCMIRGRKDNYSLKMEFRRVFMREVSGEDKPLELIEKDHIHDKITMDATITVGGWPLQRDCDPLIT